MLVKFYTNRFKVAFMSNTCAPAVGSFGELGGEYHTVFSPTHYPIVSLLPRVVVPRATEFSHHDANPTFIQ